MRIKYSIGAILLSALFALSTTVQAGLWQNFKLKRHQKKISSVKSLMLLMDDKNIGKMIHQKKDAIILQTKHRKMKWHKLEKSLIPYIRIGCERQGGFLTTNGLKESLNRSTIRKVYRGAVSPSDIMKQKRRIRAKDEARFKRKAYNAARKYAIKSIAAPNVIAVKRIEARYCIQKGRVKNAVFFLINKKGYSNKIQNLYTVFISEPRLVRTIRAAYKSGLYPAYKYTRKLQNSVSYFEGMYNVKKKGVERVYLEVNGSHELVLRIDYRSKSGFGMTARTGNKKYIRYNGRNYPMVMNIQESGETDLRISGNGCTLKSNGKLKLKRKTTCQMSVSVMIPGFKPKMRNVTFIDGDKEYNLKAISRYSEQ